LASEDQKPIRNANVVIQESANRTTTNHLGFFSLQIGQDDAESLIISHIGFLTSKIDIPEVNNFKVLLDKDHVDIAEFDLAFFSPLDSLLANGDSLSQTTKKNMGSSPEKIYAEYPRGWDHFFNDLGTRLLRDSVLKAGTDSLLIVRFRVNEKGLVDELRMDGDSSIYFNYLKSVLTSMQKWTPARQHESTVPQQFVLPIRWSRLEVFTVVEEPARPVDGMPAFYRFVGEHLRYPPKARSKGVEGRVFVEFEVEADGAISNPKIVKGIGDGCDEEAIRVLMLAPKWAPGRQKGKPVRQRMVLPITFRLGGDNTKSATKLLHSEREIKYDFDDFHSFMSGNIGYPATARAAGIEGWVVVEFSMDTISSSISNANLLADIGGNCGFEVIRVLQKAPWSLLTRIKTKNEWYVLAVGFGFEVPPERNPDDIDTKAELLEDVLIVAKGIERNKKSGWIPNVQLGSNSSMIPFANESIYRSFESAFRDFKKATSLSITSSDVKQIPAEIAMLERLQFLDLESNLIETLPNEIGSLKRLTQLYLKNNRLRELPESITGLTSLHTLGLANNRLANFPKQILRLHSLEALDLSGNDLNSIPVEVSQLKNLRQLFLQNNRLTTLPNEIVHLKKLKRLYLRGNTIDLATKEFLSKHLDKTEIIYED